MSVMPVALLRTKSMLVLCDGKGHETGKRTYLARAVAFFMDSLGSEKAVVAAGE